MSLPIEIIPKVQNRVIDLVKAAGVDVSDWSNYERGKTNPGANPKYCYYWSFIQPNQVVVLNLWLEAMQENDDGSIEQHLNYRDRASNFGPRKSRLHRWEEAVKCAYTTNLPIRVIVIDGDRTTATAKVTLRTLDPVSWGVVCFDNYTGNVVLRRGEFLNDFSDQYALPLPTGSGGKKTEVTVTIRERSSEVRRHALFRANGHCEYCGQRGFHRSDGTIYLETHHVIPLSEGGIDSIENVVALCPNHHKEAHFGDKAPEIRKAFLGR